MLTVLLRLGVHTTILSPYMLSSVLFGVGALKGLSIGSGIAMLRERFYDGFQIALVYWPFVICGLYAVVPLRFGNLYMDCFNIIWQVCVSFVANKKGNE